MSIISLRQMAVGQQGKIAAVEALGEMGRRIRDMGIIPGTTVSVVGRAPLRDPAYFRRYHFLAQQRSRSYQPRYRQLERFNFEKGETRGVRAARPGVSGKRFFPRNDRPQGLKRTAFQAEKALVFPDVRLCRETVRRLLSMLFCVFCPERAGRIPLGGRAGGGICRPPERKGATALPDGCSSGRRLHSRVAMLWKSVGNGRCAAFFYYLFSLRRSVR